MATTQVRTETAPSIAPRSTKPNGRRGAARTATLPRVPDKEEDEQMPDADPVPPGEVAEDSPERYTTKSAEGFWEWMSQFTSDDWQFMLGYLYRTSPRIDRRNNGREINIEKIGSYFDADTVMKNHGSGGYRFDLTRRNAAGRYKRIAQVYFDILNMDYPPKVPAGDWIDEPANDMWKWAKPRLEQASAMGGFPPPPQQQADPSAMLNTMLSGIKALTPASNDSTAAAAITQLGSITTQLMARPAVEDGGTKLMMTFLQTELAESRKEMRELRMHMMTAEKPKGLIEQLREIIPAVKEVTEQLGFKPGSRAADTNWGDLVTGVLEKVGDNFPFIYEMWKGRDQRPGQQAGEPSDRWQLNGRPHQQRPQAQPAQTQPTTTATPSTATATAESQPEQTGASTVTAEQQAIVKKYGQLIEIIAPFLIDYYRAGLTGFEFRDWFINRKGLDNYTPFQAEVTAQQLTDLAQLHSVLKIALAPPERLLEFLTDFMTLPGQEPAGTVTEE